MMKLSDVKVRLQYLTRVRYRLLVLERAAHVRIDQDIVDVRPGIRREDVSSVTLAWWSTGSSIA